MFPTDGSRVRALTPDECLRRLLEVSIGRISITAGALPMVLPVHFTLDGEAVLFAAVEGTPLDTATRGTVVAFQADAFDAAGAGWTVSVVGIASHLHASANGDGRTLPPVTWAFGDEGVHYVRLEPGQLFGHEIAAPRTS